MHFDDYWWFGCYVSPVSLVKMNQQFQIVGTRDDDYSYGVSGLAADTILLGGCFDDRHRGGVHSPQSTVHSLQKSDLILKPWPG